LDISDLPRPTAKTAPARRWSPQRPGDLTTPEDLPSGGAFGAIGPDTGYAARLVADREIALAPNEDRHQVDAAVVALAGARASRLGRAPTGEDIDIALLLLGYGEDAENDSELVEQRRGWLAGVGHGSAGGRALVAAVRPDVLTSTRGEVRARTRAGEALIVR
jgi:hypothetical protein